MAAPYRPYHPHHRRSRALHGRLSRLSRLSAYQWADILFAAGALATLLLVSLVVGALMAHPF